MITPTRRGGLRPIPADELVASEVDTVIGDAEKSVPAKVSVATQLVQLAEQRFRFGVDTSGEPYALPLEGPPLVRLLRGSRQSLRATLASTYFAETGNVPSQSALTDACLVLEGVAHRADPVSLHRRVAQHGDQVVLDLGDATGRCVIIDPAGARILDRPPVLFKRTALTGALPEPDLSCGDFTALWSALNVADRYQPLVLAVLVSALLSNIPHPVVLLTGEQGTGKSTATARLASIIDPSPAQLRKAPRDVETWITAADGSWVVALDNLSGIAEWQSDALCRACTGEGEARRRLYTDGELYIIAFRRVVIINGIDLGALRSDLADRLVHLALDRIPEEKRRRDEEMAEEWRTQHPRVLGALLRLTARVLGRLSSVELDRPPRMADFARVLKAVDQANGTDGLTTYLGLRGELAQDVATSDPVLVNLTATVRETFNGPAARLLRLITPSLDKDGFRWTPPKGWPSTARELTAVLTRQAPTLRELGWTVDRTDRSADRSKTVRWHLTPPARQRRADNDAADAATPHHQQNPLLSGGEPDAASGAA